MYLQQTQLGVVSLLITSQLVVNMLLSLFRSQTLLLATNEQALPITVPPPSPQVTVVSNQINVAWKFYKHEKGLLFLFIKFLLSIARYQLDMILAWSCLQSYWQTPSVSWPQGAEMKFIEEERASGQHWSPWIQYVKAVPLLVFSHGKCSVQA